MVVGSGRHIVSKSRLCHVFRAHNAAIYVRESVDKESTRCNKNNKDLLKRKRKEAKKKDRRDKQGDTDRFKKALLEACRIRQM